MKQKILYLLLILSILAFSTAIIFSLDYSPVQISQQQEQSKQFSPQDFYVFQRPIKVALVINKGQQDLELSIESILNNLSQRKSDQSISFFYEADLNQEQTDFLTQSLKEYFPNQLVNIQKIEPNLSESAYLRIINQNQSDLNVFQLNYAQNSSNQSLNELQKAHFENSFKNLYKKNIQNLSFNNAELAKAIYQFAKDNNQNMALPTLKIPTQNFQIKYLTQGPKTPTNKAILSFMGDIMLGRYVNTLMQRNSDDYPFQNLDQLFLHSNDLLVANLEGPIATRQIQTGKAIAFRFRPEVAPILKKYGFDLLSLANNHGLDMGQAGLDDSYQLLQEQGLVGFGNPRRLDPEFIHYQTINGLDFAFIGLNDVDFKVDREAVLEQIKKETSNNKLVIPFIHWGVEYVNQPRPQDVKFAHQMINSGAVAVIGHHPHVIQSFEIYNNRPIFYSLGNAIFDQYFSEDVQNGLASTIVFNLNKNSKIPSLDLTVYLHPFSIPLSQPKLYTGSQKEQALQTIIGYYRYDSEIKNQIAKGKINLSFELPNYSK